MKRVAVLRGGPSEKYSVSLQSGSAVIDALKQLKYPYKDIVITKNGEWLDEGFVRAPEVALDAIDVVFVALHGKYGEDGQVQKVLQRKGIPFTGSRSLPSAIAFNKELTKQTLLPHGILMPRHRRFTQAELSLLDEEIPHLFAEIGNELFVKPIANGSSVGAHYIPNEAVLHEVLHNLLAEHESVMIEQFIRGREATVGVLSNFRDESLYTLPVIEIVPPQGEPLYSYLHKQNREGDEIVPGRFSYHEKQKLAEIASLVHSVIDCDHFSRSDFIVRDGDVYFLEVNTLPDMRTGSLYANAASAVGLDYPQVVQHLVETAR